MEKITSFASRDLPLWNSTPLRRLKTQVAASAEASQLSASSPTMLPSGATSVRLLRQDHDVMMLCVSSSAAPSRLSDVAPPRTAERNSPPCVGSDALASSARMPTGMAAAMPMAVACRMKSRRSTRPSEKSRFRSSNVVTAQSPGFNGFNNPIRECSGVKFRRSADGHGSRPHVGFPTEAIPVHDPLFAIDG